MNALSNNLFLFIDNVADWFGWSKIAKLTYYLSSDFVCVVIALAEEKGKKQAIVKTDPETKKNDCDIQGEVNSAEAPPIDKKVLALATREAPAD